MQESDKTVMDMVDAIIESWKVEKLIKGADGNEKIERVIDNKRAWYQMHHIGCNTFGRFALERENLENLFRNSKYHMTAYRAETLEKQGLMLCEAYDHSIDAKSSECLRDPNNAQQTLLTMLSKAKTERQYKVSEELKSGIWDGIRGKAAKDSANN